MRRSPYPFSEQTRQVRAAQPETSICDRLFRNCGPRNGSGAPFPAVFLSLRTHRKEAGKPSRRKRFVDFGRLLVDCGQIV